MTIRSRLSLALAASLGSACPAVAEGFLAGKPEALADLELGLGESGLEKKGGDYEIVTGKGYSLRISSTGRHECALTAPAFFDNIYLRKVEVGKVEIKTAGLREIEMEQAGEAQIFFVAIRPGEYTWGCRNLEAKGFSGKFTVK